jgi:hypothetical protein
MCAGRDPFDPRVATTGAEKCRPGDAGLDGGGEVIGLPAIGVPIGVERPLQRVGVNPAAWEKYDAVSMLATRSITWSWYEGRSTWGTSEWASTPDSPKRRLREPADARRASSASDEARM